MAIGKNISFYLTETWVMDVSCFNANNQPLNLSNSSINFAMTDWNWIRVLVANTSNGVVVTNATGGKCSVIITPAMQVSSNIVDKTYHYEIQVILPDGTVTTQCVGELNVIPSVFGAIT